MNKKIVLVAILAMLSVTAETVLAWGRCSFGPYNIPTNGCDRIVIRTSQLRTSAYTYKYRQPSWQPTRLRWEPRLRCTWLVFE